MIASKLVHTLINSKTYIEFSKEDANDPRQWSSRTKMLNVVVITIMAIMTPLASSMFTPGINQIAEELNATQEQVVGVTTGFVVMMGECCNICTISVQWQCV